MGELREDADLLGVLGRASHRGVWMVRTDKGVEGTRIEGRPVQRSLGFSAQFDHGRLLKPVTPQG